MNKPLFPRNAVVLVILSLFATTATDINSYQRKVTYVFRRDGGAMRNHLFVCKYCSCKPYGAQPKSFDVEMSIGDYTCICMN